MPIVSDDESSSPRSIIPLVGMIAGISDSVLLLFTASVWFTTFYWLIFSAYGWLDGGSTPTGFGYIGIVYAGAA